MKSLINKLLLVFAASLALACAQQRPFGTPIQLIFDTDLGNDVDDAIAMGMLYNYAEQSLVDVLAEGISKNGDAPARYMDILNHWYGFDNIPVGVISEGADCETDAVNYARAVADLTDGSGNPVFAQSRGFDLNSLPPAHLLYRKILAKAEDNSVVFVTVGFSTNMARLLESPADEFSGLPGKELVRRKVKKLVMMAGCFNGTNKSEYNVWKDIPSAQKVVSDWETEIVFLPFELGIQVCYPAGSILNDFDPAVPHPVVEAYKAYLPMPYDRPCWDPAALVYAVEGEKYFDISPYGVIAINDEGTTSFTADQKGLHRYLMIDSEKAGKLTARIVELLTSK